MAVPSKMAGTAKMLAAVALALSLTTTAPDALQSAFQNPPPSARPHTWWHWMNGNVTKEGITADLEAMKVAGIGGAQLFTVDQGIPHGPAGYGGTLWRELTAWAVKEADRLGIELCIHNCAGWSSSGGPWVKPEDAMQVVAWSTMEVDGPAHISQDLSAVVAPQVYAKVDYHKDIAVFAVSGQHGLQAKPADFLARTGVVRGDGLEPKLGSTTPVTGQFLDITDHFHAGHLDWDAPAGDWTIVRIGHVPTGKDNHPAPPEGDGLEVDKLSKDAMDKFWSGLMAKVVGDAGPLAGKSLKDALIDSYEVGSQNWTPRMRQDFRRLRGYDPLPYLPVLAGFTVGSQDRSERFLYDYRRTIADLFAANYWGRFTQLCHSVGMVASTEPYGNGGFDTIAAGRLVDIPMGEFWIPDGSAIETVKLAASIGHVYGKPVIGAESFTAGEREGAWKEEPAKMKALGDYAFTLGLNRYIFHRYAMQPWLDLKPGMTMGPWGTHLDRTQTWWREAATWLKYVARCQSVLQQGRFVADVLYYYGEASPQDMPTPQAMRKIVPEGYDYDGCDAHALETARVVDGQVALPSGMRYRLLVLPDSKLMTPKVVRSVERLVAAGATVLGPKPEDTPSLTGYPRAGEAVRRIGSDVWGDGTSPHPYGQGKVAVDRDAGRALQAAGVAPDFAYSPQNYGTKLVYIHRTVGDADVYFVSNQKANWTTAQCTFRTVGRQPELWHPETGEIEDAPAFSIEKGRTTVPLTLGPTESVFVVFRRPAPSRHFVSVVRDSQADQVKLPDVTVKSARYETEDGRGVDVTDKVRDMVKGGLYEIPASNSAYGDPVVNVVKHLTVTYTLDGKDFTKTAAENGAVVILPMPPQDMRPAEETVRLRDPGTVEITAWKNGRFTVTDSAGRRRTVQTEAPLTQSLDHGWQVKFPPGLGAPPSARFADLVSWTERPEGGIKYFSGRATYFRPFPVSRGMLAGGRSVMLDLGDVKNFATVRVNGRPVLTLWKAPFTVDVTKFVHAGANTVEIDVTNLWPNRIIGDEQLPPDVEWDGNHLKKWPDWLQDRQTRPKTGRITFETWRYYTKDSPLLPSGLIGPVVLRSAKPLVVRLR